VDDQDATRRVRQLLLSGDDTLKNRGGGAALARARERFERARTVALGAPLAPSLIEVIDRRLAGLEAVGAAA
jgi:hypothetical protein